MVESVWYVSPSSKGSSIDMFPITSTNVMS